MGIAFLCRVRHNKGIPVEEPTEMTITITPANFQGDGREILAAQWPNGLEPERGRHGDGRLLRWLRWSPPQGC